MFICEFFSEMHFVNPNFLTGSITDNPHEWDVLSMDTLGSVSGKTVIPVVVSRTITRDLDYDSTDYNSITASDAVGHGMVHLLARTAYGPGTQLGRQDRPLTIAVNNITHDDGDGPRAVAHSYAVAADDGYTYGFMFIYGQGSPVLAVGRVLGYIIGYLNRNAKLSLRFKYYRSNGKKVETKLHIQLVGFDVLESLGCYYQTANNNLIKHLVSVGEGTISSYDIQLPIYHYGEKSNSSVQTLLSVRDIKSYGVADDLTLDDIRAEFGGEPKQYERYTMAFGSGEVPSQYSSIAFAPDEYPYDIDLEDYSDEKNITTMYMSRLLDDANFILCLGGIMWGTNCVWPTTISAATNRILADMIQADLGLKKRNDMRDEYAGRRNKPGIAYNAKRGTNEHRATSKTTSNTAQIAEDYAKGAYRGSNFLCLRPGLFVLSQMAIMMGKMIRDIDGRSQFPTIMAMLLFVDMHAPITYVRQGRVTLADFPRGWNTYGFADISYKFPPNTYMPVLTDRAVDAQTQVLEGRGRFTLIEIIAALHQGAEIIVDQGHIYQTMQKHPYRDYVGMCLEARRVAETGGWGASFFARMAKMIANGASGQIGRGIGAKGEQSEGLYTTTISKSDISHPVYAAHITAYSRIIAALAVTELEAQGIPVYSIAADGFTTLATEAEVEALELHGLAAMLRATRQAITGNPSVWKEKARTTEAVFIREMMEAFLDPSPEANHAMMSGLRRANKRSYESRMWLFNLWLAREGPVYLSHTRPPTLADYLEAIKRGKPMPGNRTQRNRVNLEPSLRRVPTGVQVVVLDDGTETININTRPTQDVQEAEDMAYIAGQWRMQQKSIKTPQDVQAVLDHLAERVYQRENPEIARVVSVSRPRTKALHLLAKHRAGGYRVTHFVGLEPKQIVERIKAVVPEVNEKTIWKEAGRTNPHAQSDGTTGVFISYLEDLWVENGLMDPETYAWLV